MNSKKKTLVSHWIPVADETLKPYLMKALENITVRIPFCLLLITGKREWIAY